ncbi:hypothetical protein [Leptolyngbya sp. NIES-2104]|uniref:hypothetical protein n=1 Tax=Leptolyngbya sp. NIES-2104 TaxID=1552121 RepID=UPI0006ECABCF|nr:hypothetical protein [Leptolyngbya sp. NIES-2104]GAP95466.1 hypothetical protein NIES2104_19880 [Leptolyngbya sp. NIES-2104]
MSSFVPVGRFFSMGDGRVGQYLSTRVLSVRTPFRRYSRSNDVCYLGFEKLSQAQKFAQSLASSRLRFSVQKSQALTQFPYEIKLYGDTETAKRLAYWDRKDHDRAAQTSRQSSVIAA